MDLCQRWGGNGGFFCLRKYDNLFSYANTSNTPNKLDRSERLFFTERYESYLNGLYTGARGDSHATGDNQMLLQTPFQHINNLEL